MNIEFDNEEDNLFDHGASSQFSLIWPFLEKIKARYEGKEMRICFDDFFVSQFDLCLSTVAERETRPNWVKNVRDYQMKSEICILLSFLSCLEIPELSKEDGNSITELYNLIQKLGNDRDWDIHILHIQFMRLLGFNLMNHTINDILPQNLDSIDMN